MLYWHGKCVSELLRHPVDCAGAGRFRLYIALLTADYIRFASNFVRRLRNLQAISWSENLEMSRACTSQNRGRYGLPSSHCWTPLVIMLDSSVHLHATKTYIIRYSYLQHAAQSFCKMARYFVKCLGILQNDWRVSHFVKCLGFLQKAWKIRHFAKCLGILQNDWFSKVPATSVRANRLGYRKKVGESGSRRREERKR